MLYLTTRNRKDAFTAHHALRSDRAADGGLFVPFQLPQFSAADLEDLKAKTFGQCTAEILNLFFNGRLTGWDVDFYIGRRSCRFTPMGRKIVMAEPWHNSDRSFETMVRNLARHLHDNDGAPSNWTCVAIRIAVLFGLYGMYAKGDFAGNDGPVDIAVPGGDLLWVVAAHYSRQMGLPLGMIVFSCGEGSGIWDLLHHAQARTDALCRHGDNLERLIAGTLGNEEAQRYHDACSKGGIYTVGEEQIRQLSDGLFCAIVSQKRIGSVIRNVYRTNDYLLDPSSASAYGALQDFRATAAETRPAWILTEGSPILSAEEVSGALGISASALRSMINGN